MKPANNGRAASRTPAHRSSARRGLIRESPSDTTRICITRAPGVCPVVDQNTTKYAMLQRITTTPPITARAVFNGRRQVQEGQDQGGADPSDDHYEIDYRGVDGERDRAGGQADVPDGGRGGGRRGLERTRHDGHYTPGSGSGGSTLGGR